MRNIPGHLTGYLTGQFESGSISRKAVRFYGWSYIAALGYFRPFMYSFTGGYTVAYLATENIPMLQDNYKIKRSVLEAGVSIGLAWYFSGPVAMTTTALLSVVNIAVTRGHHHFLQDHGKLRAAVESLTCIGFAYKYSNMYAVSAAAALSAINTAIIYKKEKARSAQRGHAVDEAPDIDSDGDIGYDYNERSVSPPPLTTPVARRGRSLSPAVTPITTPVALALTTPVARRGRSLSPAVTPVITPVVTPEQPMAVPRAQGTPPVQREIGELAIDTTLAAIGLGVRRVLLRLFNIDINRYVNITPRWITRAERIINNYSLRDYIELLEIFKRCEGLNAYYNTLNGHWRISPGALAYERPDSIRPFQDIMFLYHHRDVIPFPLTKAGTALGLVLDCVDIKLRAEIRITRLVNGKLAAAEGALGYLFGTEVDPAILDRVVHTINSDLGMAR